MPPGRPDPRALGPLMTPRRAHRPSTAATVNGPHPRRRRRNEPVSAATKWVSSNVRVTQPPTSAASVTAPRERTGGKPARKSRRRLIQ